MSERWLNIIGIGEDAAYFRLAVLEEFPGDAADGDAGALDKRQTIDLVVDGDGCNEQA